jgi:undecaprenyl-phosphate 4-deoxy-4-formamido-L-arabinose transferase
MKPYLSVVIPVYNEADNLMPLINRLLPALDQLKKSYEIIFSNDGSQDDSESILNKLHQRLKCLRIVHLSRNFGQHFAIMAGFERVRGEVVVTLDADLQNPPEEIHKLLQLIEAGHDYVGGIRQQRQDSWFRRTASKLNNLLRYRLTGIQLTDQGCMLRAYKRSLIDLMVASNESTLFIPAQAYYLARNPAEVQISHEARASGKSKYNLYRLLRLNFDLTTGFSLIPLQIFTLLGLSIAGISTLFVFFLIIRRLWIGPEVEGVFTLFAILFFFVGILLMGLGILGEYIGNIYQEVRKRPNYVVKSVVENDSARD